jgi:hypothetical protein
MAGGYKMKRLLIALVIMAMSVGVAVAEDTRSPIYEVDLSISGTTTAMGGNANYSGISWFTVNTSDSNLDITKYKGNMGVWSIQIYRIDLAKSNLNNIALTGVNASGATNQLYYTISNVDNSNIWATTGVTAIGGPPALSGSSRMVLQFTPEFAKYYKFGVMSGITQFNTIKAKLLVQ